VRVALDAQLAVGTATGIGVYQRDLTAALGALPVDLRPLQAPWLDPWRFDRRVLWDQILLPALVAHSGATVLHATAGTLPVLHRIPTIVTVHDLAWLRVQGHTRGYARAYFGGLMQRLYRGAAAIVLDSAFTRDEYVELAGERDELHVIHPGVDPRFAKIVRRPRERPFALVVGTVERRKNLLRAVEAVAAIPDLELVAVGPPTPYLDEVRARIEALGIASRVALRGYVTREELDELYAGATAVLVPSRYEGFGYAVAEGICAGVPVIAARSSSLVEVAAGAAALVDPDDADGWAGTLRALLDDRAGAERHAAAARAPALARYDWSRAAAACLELYRRFG
jgi:glycosyltransferase involved in cell wall biosynthesis